MSTNQTIQCVGVILAKQDGSVLAQLRDDNPNILNPNTWAICGGGYEPEIDKDLKAACTRELREETGYELNVEQLKFMRRELGQIENGPKVERYYYWAPYDGEQEIHCYEGQAVRFLKPSELRQLPILESNRALLAEVSSYFSPSSIERL